MKQRYLTFARAVDAYNSRLYSEWEQRVGCLATDKLKQPILCPFGVLSGTEMVNVATAIAKGNIHAPAKAAIQQNARTTIPMSSTITKVEVTPSDGKAQVILYRYGVNFATELHMIIRESKYLDRMGFKVSFS